MVTPTSESSANLVNLPQELQFAIGAYLPLPSLTSLACTCHTLSNATENPQYWKTILVGLGLELPADPAKYKETVKDFYTRFNQLVQKAGFSTPAQQVYGKFKANLRAVDLNHELQESVLFGDKDIYFYICLRIPLDAVCRGVVVGEATEKGRLDIVQALLNNGLISELDRGLSVKRAVQKGRLDIVQALLNNGPIYGLKRDEAVVEAAKKGRLDFIQILLSNGPIDLAYRNHALSMARRLGHLDIVKALEIKKN